MADDGDGKTSKRFPGAVVSQCETVNADDKQQGNGQNRWSEKKSDVIES